MKRDYWIMLLDYLIGGFWLAQAAGVIFNTHFRPHKVIIVGAFILSAFVFLRAASHAQERSK